MIIHGYTVSHISDYYYTYIIITGYIRELYVMTSVGGEVRSRSSGCAQTKEVGHGENQGQMLWRLVKSIVNGEVNGLT